MKYLLVLFILLSSCASVENKYKLNDCVAFTVLNIHSDLKPSEFREALITFKIVGSYENYYIIKILDLQMNTISSEIYIINKKDFENKENFNKCFLE